MTYKTAKDFAFQPAGIEQVSSGAALVIEPTHNVNMYKGTDSEEESMLLYYILCNLVTSIFSASLLCFLGFFPIPLLGYLCVAKQSRNLARGLSVYWI